MKLSVLLPTRNGGRYLSDCMASVLSADLDDLELVVSENASEDNTCEVLAAHGDSRLRVVHQSEPLSVTDNWSAALRAARGDHVLLIGDDDCFLPGGLAHLLNAHEDLGAPEVLTYEAYGFAFPGAFGKGSPAHYADALFPYDERMPCETPLSTPVRRRVVDEAFRFEPPLSLNLQTTLCSRRALERLPRGPFQEPYPDFYATMALLLTAESWVHLPRKLIAIGVTAKSFSGSLVSGNSDAGRAYLGVETQLGGLLPGDDLVNGFSITLHKLKRDLPAELADVYISRSNYVYRQLYAWYLFARLGRIDRKELVRRMRMLSPQDWLGSMRELARRFNLGMLRRHARVDDSSAVNSLWVGMRPAPEHRTIGEFAQWAGERERLAAGASTSTLARALDAGR